MNVLDTKKDDTIKSKCTEENDTFNHYDEN